ncbi:unnamed protein product [Leptosia nina]|uniref:Uncharacterized protein n=1 Tax=Leptosia nina TaxID=320188 RepID=A0AAV1JTQ3_9NEOP
MKVGEGTVGHVQVVKVTARDSPLPSIDYLKTSGMIKVENEKPAVSTDYVIEQDVVQYGVPQGITRWKTLVITKIATAAEESARTNKTVEIDWSKDDIPEVCF